MNHYGNRTTAGRLTASQLARKSLGYLATHNVVIQWPIVEQTSQTDPTGIRFMDSSRSLMHLTLAFGASCGAWIGVGEPAVGVGWGVIYGAILGAVVGKLMFR